MQGLPSYYKRRLLLVYVIQQGRKPDTEDVFAMTILFVIDNIQNLI